MGDCFLFHSTTNQIEIQQAIVSGFPFQSWLATFFPPPVGENQQALPPHLLVFRYFIKNLPDLGRILVSTDRAKRIARHGAMLYLFTNGKFMLNTQNILP